MRAAYRDACRSARGRPSSGSRTRSRSSISRRPATTPIATRSSRSPRRSCAGPRSSATFTTLVDPVVPLPAEITKLTGITDEMLAGPAGRRGGGRPSSSRSSASATSSRTTRASTARSSSASPGATRCAAPGSTRSRSCASRCRACARTGSPTSPRRSASARAARRTARCPTSRRSRRCGASRSWACRDLPPGLLHRLTELARDADVAGARRARARRRRRPPRRLLRPAGRAPQARRRRQGRGAPRRRRGRVRRARTPTTVLGEFSAGRHRRAHVRGLRVARRAARDGRRGARGVRHAHARRDRGGDRRGQVDRVPGAGRAVLAREPRGRGRGDQDQRAHGPARLPRAAAAERGARRRAALRRAQGLRPLPVPAQARALRRRARRTADDATARDDRRALRVGGAVALGRPRRDQPALGPRETARGDPGIAGRLHAQALPLLPATCATCTACAGGPPARNIVVTNHALLFRDVVAQGGILPPIRHWIVDEAHAAESEARKQLTMRREPRRAVGGARRARWRKGRGGLLENLRRALRGAERGERGSRRDRADGGPGRAVRDAHRLALRLREGPRAARGRQRVRRRRAVGHRRDARDRAVGHRRLDRRVARQAARGAARRRPRAHDAARGAGARDFTDGRADLVGLLSRLAEQHAGLVAVLDGEDEAFVYSATLDRRRDRDAEKLVAERLDVGEVLVDDLYPRVHSVVFTSATIATGRVFEHFARAVGLDRLRDGGVALAAPRSELRLRAADGGLRPHRHGAARRARLPRRPRAAARGRAPRDGRQRAHAVHQPARHGAPPRDPRAAARARGHHAALPEARHVAPSACATSSSPTSGSRSSRSSSFWEGFDAKGDTLRCVVVPKLPFGRPTDPLAQERERREGRAAWRRYTLPEAVIELKQAAGRLIRSRTDTGCLVIADARVVRRATAATSSRRCRSPTSRGCRRRVAVEEIRKRFGR